MALRLRRGSNADRLLITPLEGELVYTTDSKLIYIGDGATVGGVLVGIQALGSNLNLAGNDIVGTGNINITGTITASGDINLGDGVGGDTIGIQGNITSNLLPNVDSNYNIGSGSLRWNNIFSTGVDVGGQINAETINSNIVADDSTISYNKASNTFNGVFNGDLSGSVFGDDSTLLVDGVNSKIVGAVTTPNLKIEADGTDISLLTISSNVVGATGANDIVFESYGGSTLSRTNVVAGNAVVDITSKAWHTGAAVGVATMRFRTDPLGTFSNPSTGLPGSILFSTFNDAGTQPLLNFMELDCQGRLNVGGTSVSNPSLPGKVRVVGGVTSTSFMRPGVYADDTARDAAITSPAAGMMVFNTTGTKFQGYTGSVWVDLN